MVIDGVPIMVRPSIGLTVAAAESSWTVDQLLRHADLAMYAAKRQGGECIRSFIPDLPFPYTFPSFSDSAAADRSVESLPSNGSGGKTPKSNSHIAVATRDWSQDAHAIHWPPLAIRIAMAVLVLGAIAYTALSIFGGASTRAGPFGIVLYTALNVLAAGVIAVRAYRVAAERLVWALIAAGMGCSALGDVIYALWVPDGQSPSVADPVYLAYYPLVYAGLLLLLRTRLKRASIPIQLDSLVCALTMAAVAAALAAGPIHAAAMRTPETVLVGLIYPWGDLSCWRWPQACCQSAVGATNFAGSLCLPDSFCSFWRTQRIYSRPPPAHTGSGPCSTPAGRRRRCCWRWPVGRRRRRRSPPRFADSPPTSSPLRAPSWRYSSSSWLTNRGTRRSWPR
jgi:hypothetical protein